MYCKQCGAFLDDKARFCSRCGTRTMSEEITVCQTCGWHGERFRVYCPKCGMLLVLREESAYQRELHTPIAVIVLALYYPCWLEVPAIEQSSGVLCIYPSRLEYTAKYGRGVASSIGLRKWLQRDQVNQVGEAITLPFRDIEHVEAGGLGKFSPKNCLRIRQINGKAFSFVLLPLRADSRYHSATELASIICNQRKRCCNTPD